MSKFQVIVGNATTEQATTRPWQYELGNPNFEIISKDGDDIATMLDCNNESEANAAFIVRACNNHKALVEALEGLVQECQYSATSGLPFNYPDNQGQWTQLEQARAALAKAKAKVVIV